MGLQSIYLGLQQMHNVNKLVRRVVLVYLFKLSIYSVQQFGSGGEKPTVKFLLNRELLSKNFRKLFKFSFKYLVEIGWEIDGLTNQGCEVEFLRGLENSLWDNHGLQFLKIIFKNFLIFLEKRLGGQKGLFVLKVKGVYIFVLELVYGEGKGFEGLHHSKRRDRLFRKLLKTEPRVLIYHLKIIFESLITNQLKPINLTWVIIIY